MFNDAFNAYKVVIVDEGLLAILFLFFLFLLSAEFIRLLVAFDFLVTILVESRIRLLVGLLLSYCS